MYPFAKGKAQIPFKRILLTLSTGNFIFECRITHFVTQPTQRVPFEFRLEFRLSEKSSIRILNSVRFRFWNVFRFKRNNRFRLSFRRKSVQAEFKRNRNGMTGWFWQLLLLLIFCLVFIFSLVRLELNNYLNLFAFFQNILLTFKKLS